ncbi:MAG: oligosaccharide flippase family protein [Pseudomonadales bacterium]|nr:oligosaccharide flippase family protein [Pseudomonadales bacterium]
MKTEKKSLVARLLSGGLWGIISKFSAIGSNLVIASLLAKQLSFSDVALFFAFASLVAFFSQFAQMGVHQIVVKDTARAVGLKKSFYDIFIHYFVLIVFGVLIASVLMALVMHFFLHINVISNYFYLIFACVWCCLAAMQIYMNAVMKGVKKFREAALYGEAFSAVVILLLVIFQSFVLPKQLAVVLALVCFAYLLNIICARRFLNKLAGRDKNALVESGGKLLKDLFKESYPVWVSSCLIMLMSHAGIWLAGYFDGEQGLAYFGLAHRISMLCIVPDMVVASFIGPFVVDFYAKNELMKLQNILANIALCAFLPSLGLFLIFCFFDVEIITVFFSEEYLPAGELILLLAFAKVFSVFTGACGVVLLMTGHQKEILKSSWFSIGFMLVISMLLGESRGSWGVAVGVLVGTVLQNSYQLYIVKEKVGVLPVARLAGFRSLLGK